MREKLISAGNLRCPLDGGLLLHGTWGFIMWTKHLYLTLIAACGICLLSVTALSIGAPPDTQLRGMQESARQRKADDELTGQIRRMEKQQTDMNEIRLQQIDAAYNARINAIPVREWTDAPGEFSVKAKLVEIDSKSGKIKLFREGDKKEMHITIQRLSKKDKEFIQAQLLAHSKMKLEADKKR